MHRGHRAGLLLLPVRCPGGGGLFDAFELVVGGLTLRVGVSASGEVLLTGFLGASLLGSLRVGSLLLVAFVRVVGAGLVSLLHVVGVRPGRLGGGGGRT